MHAGCTLHSLRGVERPVGGVRIRRASRGKDFFFTDILSVLFRPPSLPVSHSSIRLFSYSLSLSLSLVVSRFLPFDTERCLYS